jgi:hypothetical protein
MRWLVTAARDLQYGHRGSQFTSSAGLHAEATMGQLGFFDADKRLEALSAKGDPLEAIDGLVPWESFRAEVEAVMLTSDELKKSSAGRKPFDALLMFRMLVLLRWTDETCVCVIALPIGEQI